MKKLLTLITVLFFALNAYTQSYIGVSRYSVKEALEEEGHYVNELDIEGGVKCLFVNEIDYDKAYYFEQNICVQYVLWFKDPTVTKWAIAEFLDETYEYGGLNTWYDGDVEITLELDPTYSQWKVIFRI